MPVCYLPGPRVLFVWGQGEPPAGVLGDLLDLGQPGFAELVLPPWQRETVPGSAVPLEGALRALVPRKEESLEGLPPSAVLWARAARFVADLLVRERLVPGVERSAGGLDARWSVSLVDEKDRAYFEQLAGAMPPAAHAALTEAGEPWQPAALLRVFLDDAADQIVRSGAGRRQLPPGLKLPEGGLMALQERSWGQRWGVKLAAPDRRMPAGLAERRMAEAVGAWGEPALGATDRLRAAFRLEMPAPAAEGHEEGAFTLRFLLQDPGDPSLLITAAEVWASDGQRLEKLGKSFRDPVGTLLRSLARAAPLFPPIARALSLVTPEAIELDAQGAWSFLGETAKKLTDAGFGVLVPGELTAAGRRVRLQMNFDAFDRMAGDLLGPDEPTLGEWLSFEWQVALGEQALAPEEFDALVRQKVPLVKHRGQWVMIDPEELPKIQARLKARKGKLGAREGLVATLAGELSVGDLRVRTRAVGRFAELLARLRGGAEREVEPPAGLNATLRPYQKRGLSWLATMASLGLGSCLADDMGLGKTVQFIAFLLRAREGKRPPSAPSLLVAPTSVLGNWERELARFAPSLPIHRHYGPARATGPAQIEQLGGALVLTTYSMLWRDAALLARVPWWAVALDEAQNIKNSHTATAKAARSLGASHRFALTGTPVENRLAELWSILDFTNPGLLGPEDRFARDHARPIEQGSAPEAERLKKIVGPFILRRLKSDPAIAPDLPAKDEMNIVCTLTREQATLYQAAVDQAMAAIAAAQGMARRGLILALLTRLKQICNHPAQFLREAGPLARRSGKLERLTEMLEETAAEGEKALIFTQYREMGDRLCKHLEKALKTRLLYLHGQTPRDERDRMVQSFQAPEPGGPSLFVLSLKAGGTGLNLTAASQVFHYDRWWNPAVEDQATDRAYRIGQEKHVQVFKFVCAGTVEDRIDKMIEKKKALAGKIIGGGENWITELGDSDLRELFSLSSDAILDDEPAAEGPKKKGKKG